MKILVDIYKARDPYSGLGQFSTNFAKTLLEHVPEDINVTFLKPSGLDLGQGTYSSTAANWQKRYFPRFSPTFDLWHSLHQFPSHRPNGSTPQILTIHDLNFLTQKSAAKQKKYLSILQRNVDRADHVTTISNFTKGELEQNIDLHGKPVHVIHNGISLEPCDGCPAPGFMPVGPFFLSMGVFMEKKNFHVLIPMMKHFPEHRLVIAGNNKGPYGNWIRQMAEEQGVSDRVIIPGPVTDENRFWLYQHCEAFLFPSVAEGFGMPPIEAMTLGKPVFLSKSTSLPEVGGDAAHYFDSFEEDSMATTIQQGLQRFKDDPALHDQVREHAAKFNWEACINGYLDLYREIT